MATLAEWHWSPQSSVSWAVAVDSALLSGLRASSTRARRLFRLGSFAAVGGLTSAEFVVSSAGLGEGLSEGGSDPREAAIHASNAALISAFRLRRFCFLSACKGLTNVPSIRSAYDFGAGCGI